MTTGTGPQGGARRAGEASGSAAPVRRDALASQPEGTTQRVILNALEAFFRRPLVHLIPFFLLVGLGVFTSLTAPDEYRSIGVLNVTEGELLADIGQGDGGVIGFDPLATTTASNLNNLLKTGTFMSEVIETAGLTTVVRQGIVTIDDLRAMIMVEPNGDNLVAVWATTEQADLSHRLADATLQTFREFNLGNDISDAQATVTLRERQYERYLQRYEAAVAARDQFVVEHPAPAPPLERSTDEQAELGALTEELTRARNQLSDAESQLDEAEIAVQEARNIFDRKLRILDPPTVPETPEPRLKAAVLTTAMFAVMGLILSAGFLFLSASVDRSVRTPGDVVSRFGVEVAAVIPQVRK